jgi:ABC-2 type transport system ATP-binding protein
MIELIEVTKNFGRRRVLDQVSLTAAKGEITCLIGMNGAGKSTIMKAIMGLTPIHSGQILIDGEKLHKNTYERIAFIPDTITMPPQFTVFECMQFMKDFYLSWNDKRALELLHFFKLNGKDRISELSKGNAAKANMLLGLSLDVDYLLMDEPFSGIDLFSREQIASVFTSHLIEDRGVMITTHEINDIEHLLDKVLFLNDGMIVKQFQTEDMRLQQGKSVIDVMREVYKA